MSGFFEVKNIKRIYSLFELIYDDKRYMDKIEIVRHVFTLYLNDGDTIEELDKRFPKILKTVENNFQSYIQEKIEKFFNQRKDLEKEAREAAKEAKSSTDKITQQINVLMLTLITATFTSIFAYSKSGLVIFYLAILFHALYIFLALLINWFGYHNRSNEISVSFDNYSSNFSVLSSDKNTEIKEMYINKPIKKLRNIFCLYKFISVSLIILLIIVALFVRDYDQHKKNEKSEKNIQIEMHENYLNAMNKRLNK
jgi:hypothetical protein